MRNHQAHISIAPPVPSVVQAYSTQLLSELSQVPLKLPPLSKHQDCALSTRLAHGTAARLPDSESVDKSENKGLASVDRSNKATLLLTAPRSSQVVCKGFTPAHIPFMKGDDRGLSAPAARPKYGSQHKAYSDATNTCGTNIVVSSTDSGLEAFSHNLTDDSFAPLPDRTDADTNYPDEQFLSYYPRLLLRRPSISRVKLTCLTTV